EAHPVEGNLAPHVVLRGDEVARADAALVLDDEVSRGLLRRSAAHLREIRKRLAGEWLERLVLERNEEHAFGAARGEIEVLPVRTRRAHLALDALTEGPIPKPSEPRAKTALLDPWRHARVEPGRTRGVRIHVGGDVESSCACLLDALDDGRKLRPVCLPRLFEVIDLRADAGTAGDLDELVDGLDQAIPFVPDIPLALDLIPSHRVGERTHRGSLAEDFERDALMHIARRAPVRDERRDRPREHVDEAGCDRETGCIDLAPAAISDRRHDRDD